MAFLTTKMNKCKRSPVNYLDDYLFSAYLKTLCNQDMQAFLDLCQYINFPISEEKTFWATTTLVFLRLLIDTVNQYVGIPVDKVDRARNLITEILKGKKITVRQLQKLCGFLNFLCKCIVPGRAFTRRLYSKFNTLMKPHYPINVNLELRSDLNTWLTFLNEPTVYCRPFIDYSVILSVDGLKLYTDALGVVGFGGIHNGSDFFSGTWDPIFLRWAKPSIEYQELFAATVAILLWAKNYANKRVCIFVDNKSIRDMINNTSSNCKNCMVLIRLIVLECLTWNMRVFAKYIETKQNSFADALTRNQR